MDFVNPQVLACNQDWLQASNNVALTTTVDTLTGRALNCYPSSYYTHWYYPVYQTSLARPIKLKLSEVERLRKAARADKALKAILEKFTSQIEITVDFD